VTLAKGGMSEGDVVKTMVNVGLVIIGSVYRRRNIMSVVFFYGILNKFILKYSRICNYMF